jgi:hypothetical protein
VGGRGGTACWPERRKKSSSSAAGVHLKVQLDSTLHRVGRTALPLQLPPALNFQSVISQARPMSVRAISLALLSSLCSRQIRAYCVGGGGGPRKTFLRKFYRDLCQTKSKCLTLLMSRLICKDFLLHLRTEHCVSPKILSSVLPGILSTVSHM